jgi:hypothetical protein
LKKGLWLLVFGLSKKVFGFWSLVFRRRSLGAGRWSFEESLWVLVVGLSKKVFGFWSLASGLWSLVFGEDLEEKSTKE